MTGNHTMNPLEFKINCKYLRISKYDRTNCVVIAIGDYANHDRVYLNKSEVLLFQQWINEYLGDDNVA